MTRQKSHVAEYKGRFHRTLGRVRNERGEVVPKKFLLGTDAAKAEVANRLLEQLWDQVVAEHEGAVRFLQEMGDRLGDINNITFQPDFDHHSNRRVDHGPVWRAESLVIAEAIRRGKREIVVPVGANNTNYPGTYVERIIELRRTYPVIAFVPASAAFYAEGQAHMASEARGHVEEAKNLAQKAESTVAAATGQMLYQALDAYGTAAAAKNPKEAGLREKAAAQRLKASHSDIPLADFGMTSLERIAAYWASRPQTKRTRQPLALSTVTNHLKTARRFIRWLNRTDMFDWSKPIDAEEALRIDVERLRTDREVAELGEGVKVWTNEELVTLYHRATDQERLLLLLGLNCAFSQAEICGLLRAEIQRQGEAVFIKRIRRKSRVPGVFPLWPQTSRALAWFEAQRPKPDNGNAAYFMVTQKGALFDRQRISNIWDRLLDRVEKNHHGFRRLSFKCLRKTAGQLIRDRSDGEITGVFLCHGRAVKTDDLADVYTNRPFGKVAAALEQVRIDLQPMFDAAKGAFTKR